MRAVLEFDAQIVRRLITHAVLAKHHSPGYGDWENPEMYPGGQVVRYTEGPYKGLPNAERIDGTKVRPALSLVKDHGIYLMSNGLPILHDPYRPDMPNSSLVAYAKTYDPATDPDWYDRAQKISRDDFCETIILKKEHEMMLSAITETSLVRVRRGKTATVLTVVEHRVRK